MQAFNRVSDTGSAVETKRKQPLSFDDVPFSVLVSLYNDLRKVRNTAKRNRFGDKNDTPGKYMLLTRAWLKVAELCGRGGEILANRSSDECFVPAQIFPPDEAFKLISLLVPALDSAHVYLGMKETKLADAFVKALDLLPNGADAQWLRHHKENEYRPERWKQDPEVVDGNLATILKAVLTDRCPTDSSLTFGIVWKTLDNLSRVSRTHHRRFTRPSSSTTNRSTTIRSDPSAENDSTTGQDVDRSSCIRSLIQVSSAREVAEVARIILKDMDIRLSQDSFLSWYHPNAKQHYTQIHDIHKLLKDCYDPTYEIGEASVHIGQYASVMLTMRPSRKKLDVICEKLRGKGGIEGSLAPNSIISNTSQDELRDAPYFIMEPKLDGERLQLHKWKETADDIQGDWQLKTFSRRGNDSSAMYAEALREVVLAGVNAEGIILDGEIMIWDELKASWLRFESLREVGTAIAKKSVPEGCSYVLKYMVFDVLYVDQGTKKTSSSRRTANMVIRLPLHKRRVLLEKLITSREAPYGIGAKAKIEVVDMERGYDERQLTQALQRYETLGYEGAIAKNPDMPYVLAERSLDLSIKLKPDYFDGGIQDLDVLILGARYSTSSGHRLQRSGKLSSFLVGVRTSESDAPKWKGRGLEWETKMKQCRWTPIASVGTGYSDTELAEIQKLCAGDWKDFDTKDLPEHFEKRKYTPLLFADIAKWIEPWKSVVLTIRAFELNRKNFVLRFPRVERINWEKPYYDVPTFDHVVDLDEQKGPAFIRPDENDIDDVQTVDGKKSRVSAKTEEEDALKRAKEEGHVITGGRTSRSVISSAIGADISQVSQVCHALQGLSFFVLSPDRGPKEVVEIKIHELGGCFVQNFSSKVDFIICTSRFGRVKQMKEAFERKSDDEQKCSIIQNEWIDECHTKKMRIVPALEHVVYATVQLESELFRTADRFGDSWKDVTDTVGLQKCVNEVEEWRKASDTHNTQGDDMEIENDIDKGMKTAGNTFRGVSFYAPATEIRLDGTLGLLRAMGAKVVTEDGPTVLYVLLHSSIQAKWMEQSDVNKKRVVNEAWVRKCFEDKVVIDPC